MIEDSAFNGADDISVKDLRRVAVKSFSDISNKIYNTEDDTPQVFCGLTLSSDNSVIKNATPVVLGKLHKLTFPAGRFLGLNGNLTLNFETLDLTQFNFISSMTSELLDHRSMGYSIINKEGVVISGESLKSQGFKGFSLRMFLQPLSGLSTKIIILLYPLSTEDLKKTHTLSIIHAFPGMMLHHTNGNLSINALKITNTRFGSPILPLVKITKPLENHDQIPTSRQISSAISVLFRNVTIAETKPNYRLLQERWKVIKEKGAGGLIYLRVYVIWPFIAETVGKFKS